MKRLTLCLALISAPAMAEEKGVIWMDSADGGAVKTQPAEKGVIWADSTDGDGIIWADSTGGDGVKATGSDKK